jgi:hypothetical protein
MGIAIAMVTGQSGKVAAVVPQKLHSVVGYIVCFSNIRKISNPFMCLTRILHEGFGIYRQAGKAGWTIARGFIDIAMDQGG